MLNALQSLISELERDRSLLEPSQLRRRIDVLDRLDIHLTGGLRQDRYADPILEANLHDRIKALCTHLEALNHGLYQAIRQDIKCGRGAQRLLEWISPADAGHEAHGESYDYLDALVSGVLQIDEPDAGVAALAAEMVFYQPSPARHIFDLLGRSPLSEHDVLIDLGSGLGHVPLLAAIFTGAHCIGIERETIYVDCARRCAHALNLSNATFVQQDVRAADLSAGTVFYMYTPFTGTIMSHVLGMLKHEAAMRRIRICTLGPCTPIVARESWLEAISIQDVDRPALFHSM